MSEGRYELPTFLRLVQDDPKYRETLDAIGASHAENVKKLRDLAKAQAEKDLGPLMDAFRATLREAAKSYAVPRTRRQRLGIAIIRLGRRLAVGPVNV